MAALWCWAFGRAVRLWLDPWLPIALALGTWLFYVADRLLDAQFSPDSTLQERHRFHQRHRRWFLAAAVPVAVALAVLVARMPRSLIAAYCVLGAALAALSRAGASARARTRPLAPLFPQGVRRCAALRGGNGAARLGRRRAPLRRHTTAPSAPAPLSALCCALLAELHGYRGMGAALVAATASRWLAAAIIAASCLSLFGLAIIRHARIALAAAVSAALFLILDRSRLAAGGRRIAADLALLTPALLIPVLLPIAHRLHAMSRACPIRPSGTVLPLDGIL